MLPRRAVGKTHAPSNSLYIVLCYIRMARFVPLHTISMRNLNDPDFDLSRSLDVKCNFVVDFLLVSNTKHMSISHRHL